MTLPDDVYHDAKLNLAFLQGAIAAYGDVDSKWRVFETLRNAIDANFHVSEYELYKNIEELETTKREDVRVINDLRHKIRVLEGKPKFETPKKKGWFRR
jgi:hypothetical protein